MTFTVPLSIELADSPCSVADCLETAHTMGSASVRPRTSRVTPSVCRCAPITPTYSASAAL